MAPIKDVAKLLNDIDTAGDSIDVYLASKKYNL
jgi:hypothetical protein